MEKRQRQKDLRRWLVFLMLFLVVCMEILMFVAFAELVPLCGMGLTWLYFAMAGTMALALSMLGSVFMTQAQLYDAKDNELLLFHADTAKVHSFDAHCNAVHNERQGTRWRFCCPRSAFTRFPTVHRRR